LVGKHGASLTPSAKRKVSSDARLVASPCNNVDSDQNVSDRKYVSLVPNRSRKIPPGICIAAYVQENAEKTMPIVAALNPSSFVSEGAAMPSTVRSR